ncbi:DMT family transporter [Thalassotalea agarivorans]|uniref:Uncharacterized membrane protein n=1 Tax=Thalassotalea agarivorans TaxID=349064 RepID=A0A1I0FYN6_THASX|nr:DMT family transporter [Thalassotalea agarivorans]SET63382.1 Uncharacterized membrane protein [Thalassotalea agarivorans]
MKTIMLTCLALLAFAANSVFCRLALAEGEIDAASFTVIRLVSGAFVLALILAASKSSKSRSKGSWLAAISLFAYAAAFTYAYLSLDTATGAVILFATVQITMIVISVIQGVRPSISQWLGISIALIGFVYLMLPGVSVPSYLGFSLMALSGVSWALYTVLGKGSKHPLSDTCFNFVRTLPIACLLLIVALNNGYVSLSGVMYAIASGALASGVGYTIWYIAIKGLSSIQAAVVQLLVPVLAGAGGIMFADEQLTYRLAISSALILFGILLVTLGANIKRQSGQGQVESAS